MSFDKFAQDAVETAETARAVAEAMMKSRCTIRAGGSGKTTDPVTGAVAPALGAVIYSGKCKIKPAGSWGRTAEAGGEQVSPSMFQVSIPFRVTNVERNQWVTIDSSPDGWFVGRRFQVRFSPQAGDYISSRRLLCEEA
ncbi:DUF6093 family protein [Geodermatophilus sp. DSM 45219]|uniref:DUF6093 family protein n=1 Tax=Geodermatophilus sp. DSM 45219 TaxID=1881103 RepID=UPI000882C546|nr:DUF6093 family protein [Geodermatophilus sp. DSM 45219]SDN79143.1 hypothetical protein SAMN05428965_1642 [Geodermatophilus sp. DSM 45219]